MDALRFALDALEERARAARTVLRCLPNEARPAMGAHGWEIVHTCIGCQNWTVEHREPATVYPWPPSDVLFAAAGAVTEHRAECPALDMLLGLRLPLPN